MSLRAEYQEPGQAIQRSWSLDEGVFLSIQLTYSEVDLSLRLLEDGREVWSFEPVWSSQGTLMIPILASTKAKFTLMLSTGRRAGEVRLEEFQTSNPSKLQQELARGFYVLRHNRNARAALAIFRAAKDDAGAAEALLVLADQLVSSRKPDEALDALDLLPQLMPPRHLEAALLDLRARCLRMLGEDQLAIESWRCAAGLADLSGDTLRAGLVANNWGYHAYLQGRGLQALHLYQEALDFYLLVGAEDQRVRTRLNMAEVYHLLGQPDDARFALQQILSPDLEDNALAEVLIQLGWSFHVVREYGQAISYFESALVWVQDEGLKAAAFDRLGSSLRLSRDFEAAMSCYEKALANCDARQDALGAAHVRANIAKVLFDRGQLEEAWHSSETALAGLERLQPSQTSALHVLRSRIARFREGPEAARSHMERALEVVDTLYRGAGSMTFKRSVMHFRHDYLAEFALLLHELGEDEAALLMLDDARARALRQRLSLPYENSEPTDSEVLARLRMGHLGEARELLHLSGQVLTEKPVPPPLPPLVEDEQQLFFSLSEPTSLVWLRDHRGVRVFVLPDRASIEHLATRLYQEITRSHLRSGQKRWQAPARELSDMILGPLAAELRGKRLTIVADGKLHLVPFAALSIPGTDRLLLQDFQLAYLPSLITGSVLANRAQNQSPRARLFAAFADPVFAMNDERLGKTPSPSISMDQLKAAGNPWGIDALPRLQFSGEEAEQAVDLAGSHRALLLQGFAAHRQAFLDEDWRDTALLHFSTHGVLHPLPELSGLVLSQLDQQGRAREGFLTALDIGRKELPVSLVVLSACRSALGEDVRGEGVWGLSGSFMAAGAKAVIASIWNVRERPTSLLFATFYRRLLLGCDHPAAALRAAQLELYQSFRWQAPYYWAGWIFQGDQNFRDSF